MAGKNAKKAEKIKYEN